jgi:DNA repair protein RadC
MKKAANTFDIALLDHVIITDGCYFSFAEGMAVTVRQETEGV